MLRSLVPLGIGVDLGHSDGTACGQVQDGAAMGLHDHAVDHFLVVVLEEFGWHGGFLAVCCGDGGHFESRGVEVAAHAESVPTRVGTRQGVAA